MSNRMLDLFFLPIVIAFLWPTTNIKDTKNGEILTGAIPTLLFSFNAFINPLLYAFRVEKFQQAIKIRFDTIYLGKSRAGSWSNSYSNSAITATKRTGSLAPMPLPKPGGLGSTDKGTCILTAYL